MPCSDIEAELRILEAAAHGVLLSRKGKHKAIQYGRAVLIVYEQDKNFDIVKTVETTDYSGWWKKEKIGTTAL